MNTEGMTKIILGQVSSEELPVVHLTVKMRSTPEAHLGNQWPWWQLIQKFFIFVGMQRLSRVRTYCTDGIKPIILGEPKQLSFF